MCILLVLWKIKFHMKIVDLFIIDSSIFKLDNMQQFLLQRQRLWEIIINRFLHHHLPTTTTTIILQLVCVSVGTDHHCQRQ